MGILRVPAWWLLGIARHFPTAVQPGVYLAMIILLIWAVFRGRRPIYNAALRLTAVTTDFVVGLVLLPEFAVTRVRRANGGAPGGLTLAGGRVAEKLLDTAADIYAAHPLVRISKRPPLLLIALLLVASGVEYWLLHKTPPNSATRVAHEIWKYWVQFERWTRGK
jgi:hypothetical protein